jgi:uncharacterized coiled-coil protein SlyX
MTDNAEPAREDTRTLCQGHSSDIERFYARFREHDGEIVGVKHRVQAVETRLFGLEQSIFEQGRKLTHVDDDVTELTRDVKNLQEGQDTLTNLTRALTATMAKHTIEEGEWQRGQTDALQKLARNVMMGVAVLGFISITLASINAMVSGEGLELGVLFGLLGLGS